MIHLSLRFGQTEEIVRFVRVMNKYEYGADIKCGSRVVDAKSIIGVLSLAKNRTVELILHTEECGGLLEEIAPYAA